MARDYTLKGGVKAGSTLINYEAELNADQFSAVSAEPGPLLVIAGAGSGKTRTLTYRVAWLVEHGIDPAAILLLTFTNKAAKEMMRRVGDLVPHDFSRMWGGTFHHVGHRMLRRHGERVGLRQNFSIFDQEDSKDLIDACLRDAPKESKDPRFPKPELLQSIFSLAANTVDSISATIGNRFPHLSDLSEPVAHLAAAYNERKRANNAVDYDDLLVLSLQLLRDNPEVLDDYQSRFRHILVDEYQDTNRIQAEMVDLLAGSHHRVMVVGDDAQSIYSWRGAHFENIIQFPDRHPNTRVVRIETNYRSTPQILAVANASISHNTQQFPKVLRAVNAEGPRPARVQVQDTRQQARFVAQRVLEMHSDGTPLNEIAVLYRSHYHSMELQMELTRQNIPFQITSGLRFFEQAHVKDVAAYLRLAVNPDDEVSFHRCALMLPGVGAATAGRLWKAVTAGTPWADIPIPAKGQAAWLQWGETQGNLRDLLGHEPPDRLIQLILDALYEDYLKRKYPNHVARLEDLRQLQSFADGFTDTAEFLAQLSLMTNLEARPVIEESQGVDDSIRLSSIHQAKGLEWRAVFVLMLSEGQFPNSRALEAAEAEEEERRLFYVAVTRAQEELYLLSPRVHNTRNAYGAGWIEPSRFVEELGPELTETWRITDDADVGWDSA